MKSPLESRVLTATLLVAALLPGALAAQGQCPSGLIGYWPLDGDGTEAVNGFPGTLVGNVGFEPGIVDTAASFAGDVSYIDAGAHAELTDFGGNQMSVAAWIYREADGPAGDSDGAVITARTFCNEGNFQFYDHLGTNVYYSKWLSGTEDQIFSGYEIPLGEWVHVAVTYATDEVRFYVNGLPYDSVSPLPFGGPINDHLQNVQVGWDSCGSYFTGMLDEVAVWNVTLTEPEVADLFTDGIGGVSLCTEDEDGDGVLDEDDVCSGTTGEALVDGCDCSQILDVKPGGNAGEARNGCSAGTLNVFQRRIGWAKDVPLPPV